MTRSTTATPLLSITVLNYNYGHFLPTCLDSILRQSFTDFEILLINDTSTDNSLEVIAPYLADPRVHLINHTVNQGFVKSLIEGSEQSRGEYITVISADDWVLDQDAFAKQVALLEHDSAIAFVYSDYSHYVDELTYESTWQGAPADYVLEGQEAFQQLVVNPFLLHSGTMIRKTAYTAVSGYDTNTTYLVDTRMWLSLCHVGKVAYIKAALYAYRRHTTNMSRHATALRSEIREVLNTLAWSFSKHPLGQSAAFVRLRHNAEQRALVAFAIDDIFRNQYRNGWRNYWIAAQIRPIQTILQKDTALMGLRTISGQRGYAFIHRLLTGNKA